MHTYLFNLEKGGLHEVLDPRELDNTDENARAITLMCFEEFKADKTIPYKSGLLRNWDRRTISKVERYNTYVQGILHIPAKDSGRFPAVKLAFHLDGTGLSMVEDGKMLEKFFHQMEKTPVGACSLTGFLLTVLNMLVEDDEVDLEKLEDKLARIEENLLHKLPDNFYPSVIQYRKELAALRSFYEQLINIGEQMQAGLDQQDDEREYNGWRMFIARCDRLHDHVEMLKEYLLQIRELYQSQIDVQQNRVMTFLTVVTTIFMPLTLITGWFGMNFPNMFLMQKPYGYLIVIGVSIALVAAEFYYFRKKKML